MWCTGHRIFADRPSRFSRFLRFAAISFWATVQQLDVPFYLHPRVPLATRQQAYEGHPWLLGSAWGFAAETSLHALRLMGSGLFDEYPKLKVILGHLGEGLPFSIWRVDHRISKGGRPLESKAADGPIPARELLHHYQRELPHAGADRRVAGSRQRPRFVLGGLPVRGHGRGSQLVRPGRHQRTRSLQNRLQQRTATVPPLSP